MADLSKILKKVNQLDPIPTVIHKVLDLAADPESALEEMVSVVERDPAITANDDLGFRCVRDVTE